MTLGLICAIVIAMRVAAHLLEDRKKLRTFATEIVDMLNNGELKAKITNFGFYKFNLENTSSLMISTVGGKRNLFYGVYESWLSAVDFLENLLKKNLNVDRFISSTHEDASNFLLVVNALNSSKIALLPKNIIAMRFLPSKINGDKEIEISAFYSLLFFKAFPPYRGDVNLNINLYLFGEFFIKNSGVRGLFLPTSTILPTSTNNLVLFKGFDTLFQVINFINDYNPIVIDAEKVEVF